MNSTLYLISYFQLTLIKSSLNWLMLIAFMTLFQTKSKRLILILFSLLKLDLLFVIKFQHVVASPK